MLPAEQFREEYNVSLKYKILTISITKKYREFHLCLSFHCKLLQPGQKIFSVAAGYLPVNESVERPTPNPASWANPDHSWVVWRGLTAAWSPPRPERKAAWGVNGKIQLPPLPKMMSKTKMEHSLVSFKSSSHFFRMKAFTKLLHLYVFFHISFCRINVFWKAHACLVIIMCFCCFMWEV